MSELAAFLRARSAVLPMRVYGAFCGLPTEPRSSLMDYPHPNASLMFGGTRCLLSKHGKRPCCGGIMVDTVDGMGQNTVLSKADVQHT